MIRITRLSSLQLLLLAWLFISILGGIEILLLHLTAPEVIRSDKAYWLPLMRIVNGYAGILLVILPGHRFLKNKKWSTRMVGYFVLMILFSLVYLVFSVGQFQFSFLLFSMKDFLHAIAKTVMSDLHHIASYYFFLLFILLGKEYFEERTGALVKKEQLEKELSETQLKVLQRQIQPHFLFNTLNNVVAIIDERKEVAQEMLVELSELLRLSNEMNFAQKISLERELEILTCYLSIEKKRFEHQLSYKFQIDDASKSILVPPFLLQPIIENAIKHGFKGRVEKLSIEIVTSLEQGFLVIQISNNGAPIRNTNFGIGLSNCKERLENAYENNYEFGLKQIDKKVINYIKIPAK